MSEKKDEQFKIQVVGGQMSYSTLKANVGARVYAIGKAHIWLNMINKRKRPKKWNKPNSKGTKVTFEVINSAEMLEQAFAELEEFIGEINQTFGTDLTLNREPV